MDETSKKTQRPISITIICVVGFIGTFITIPLIFSPIAEQIGSWYPPYLGFASIVGLACMVGLWMMRKWAAYTYTGLVAFNQIFLLIMGLWNIATLLIPGIVIFFALKNSPKMT